MSTWDDINLLLPILEGKMSDLAQQREDIQLKIEALQAEKEQNLAQQQALKRLITSAKETLEPQDHMIKEVCLAPIAPTYKIDYGGRTWDIQNNVVESVLATFKDKPFKRHEIISILEREGMAPTTAGHASFPYVRWMLDNGKIEKSHKRGLYLVKKEEPYKPLTPAQLREAGIKGGLI